MKPMVSEKYELVIGVDAHGWDGVSHLELATLGWVHLVAEPAVKWSHDRGG